MPTNTEELLSGSTNGRAIAIVATITPGTLVHTSVSGTTSEDNLWLYASSKHTTGVEITIEYGGTTTTDQIIVSIPPKEGLVLIIPGLPLNNGLMVCCKYRKCNFYCWNGSPEDRLVVTIMRRNRNCGKIDSKSLKKSAYFEGVIADAPISYWRLGEVDGVVAQDSSGFSNTGTYNNGCILGGVGSLNRDSNTAVTFDGIAGLITTMTSYNNPQIFSLEARFKTIATNTQGIIGFEIGSSFDRRLYLNPSGKVEFMVFASGPVLITSPLSYNDGNWHSVVVAFSNVDGRKLYVDGILVASANVVSAAAYEAKWIIGRPQSTDYFNGTLDEIAIYNKILSPERIANHHSNT